MFLSFFFYMKKVFRGLSPITDKMARKYYKNDKITTIFTIIYKLYILISKVKITTEWEGAFL